uniref:NADH-ubiquinone oxidoreductase chain 4 n=1 Tax=Pterocladiophila hemisphaerica TaxID=2712948 RepID=A0A6M3WWL3_9FLOR|nr:Nad4 [Pterocladiophila hemisphaerica]
MVNFIYSNLLMITALMPLLSALFLLVIPSRKEFLCWIITLIGTIFTFFFSLLLLILFNTSITTFQFIFTFFLMSFTNLYYTVGIDGISLYFILLTTFLCVICVLLSWNSIKFMLKEYLICFLMIEFFLIQVFIVLDIFLFYIFFESVLIPMFCIIGIWGSRKRKISASYQFFLYTLIGSLFMLLGLISIYIQLGSTDLQFIWTNSYLLKFPYILWFSFFISLAIKIPIVPVHTWLPEAHAEAPTSGSVILAGILLKLGSYGFLRILLPIFPEASIYFAPFILVLSLLNIIYASLVTLRQIDLKKIIAYSSIAHMGFVTAGIFTFNLKGLEGSIFLMIGHGLVSSGLFICIGILYDRYLTRIVKYYGGLTQVMPIFSFFLFIFLLANMGFPGTCNFIGEFLILLSLINQNKIVALFALGGIFLSGAYSLWFFNKVMFGILKTKFFVKFQDLSRREFYILCIFSFLIFVLGLYPIFILNNLHLSVNYLLQLMIK